MPSRELGPQEQSKDSQRCSKKLRILFIVIIAMVLSLTYGIYMNSEMLGPSTELTDRPSLSPLRKKFWRSTKKPLLQSDSLVAAKKSLVQSDRSPVILLWTARYSDPGLWVPKLSSLRCQVSDCIITRNRKLFNVSDAVFFHLRSVDVSDLPQRLNPNQRWVLFNGESPSHTPEKVLAKLAGKINWTATYREDSDFYDPYGFVVRRKDPVSIIVPPAGRKLVSWLVSNCNTESGREKFVDNLKQFIPVDVYGRCGNLQCPVNDRFGCYKALSKKYKFYLSFENSICKDYVTEKLFNALRTDMVPIVMGGANYSRLLPPNSYIDALNFTGPQQLAHYLRELDNDDNKYSSYLAWKKDYEILPENFQWTCDVCRKLHDNDIVIHDDLISWWFHDAPCTSWEKAIQNTSSKQVG